VNDAATPFGDLMARARGGDAAALEALARQYEREVRIMARVLLGPALRPYLDSIDVVQSVHRSLMAGLRGGKFDLSSPDKLVGLAVTMLRRKVARQWRRLRKQDRLSHGAAGAADDGPRPEPWDADPESRHDPAREAEFHDAARALYAQLNETEQSILELRLQGYTTKEIAARLGINPIALRVRLSRLRKRLEERGALADWV